MKDTLINKIAYLMLFVITALTLLNHELARVCAEIFSSLRNADGSYELTLFIYIFMATTAILFISILVLNNKTYLEKLGLIFPWKQFKPGWFIVICLLWILAGVPSKFSPPSFSLDFVIAVIMAPLIEELIFRGFIQGLLPTIPLWKWAKLDSSVILMSLFFSLWHFDVLKPSSIMLIPFLLHFCGGLTLGMLKNQTGSIWLGIIIHALGNLAAQMHGVN